MAETKHRAPSELIVTFEALQELGGRIVNQGENIRGWAQFGPAGIAEARKHLAQLEALTHRAQGALDKLEETFQGWGVGTDAPSPGLVSRGGE